MSSTNVEKQTEPKSQVAVGKKKDQKKVKIQKTIQNRVETQHGAQDAKNIDTEEPATPSKYIGHGNKVLNNTGDGESVGGAFNRKSSYNESATDRMDQSPSYSTINQNPSQQALLQSIKDKGGIHSNAKNWSPAKTSNITGKNLNLQGHLVQIADQTSMQHDSQKNLAEIYPGEISQTSFQTKKSIMNDGNGITLNTLQADEDKFRMTNSVMRRTPLNVKVQDLYVSPPESSYDQQSLNSKLILKQDYSSPSVSPKSSQVVIKLNEEVIKRATKRQVRGPADTLTDNLSPNTKQKQYVVKKRIRSIEPKIKITKVTNLKVISEPETENITPVNEPEEKEDEEQKQETMPISPPQTHYEKLGTATLEGGQRIMAKIAQFPVITKAEIQHIRQNNQFARRNNSLAVKTSRQIRDEAELQLYKFQDNQEEVPKMSTAQLGDLPPLRTEPNTSYDEYVPHSMPVTGTSLPTVKPLDAKNMYGIASGVTLGKLAEDQASSIHNSTTNVSQQSKKTKPADDTGKGWKNFEIKHDAPVAQIREKDIFDDDQKKQANQIFQKRLESFIKDRQIGYNGLNAGNLHKKILKEDPNPFTVFKKKKYSTIDPKPIIYQYPAPKRTIEERELECRGQLKLARHVSSLAHVNAESKYLDSFHIIGEHENGMGKQMLNDQSNEMMGVPSTIFIDHAQLNMQNDVTKQGDLAVSKGGMNIASENFIGNQRLNVPSNLEMHHSGQQLETPNMPAISPQFHASPFQSAINLEVSGRITNDNVQNEKIQDSQSNLNAYSFLKETMPGLSQEQSIKLNEMSQYLSGLQGQFSHSTIALRNELKIKTDHFNLKKNKYLSKDRVAHSYIPVTTRNQPTQKMEYSMREENKLAIPIEISSLGKSKQTRHSSIQPPLKRRKGTLADSQLSNIVGSYGSHASTINVMDGQDEFDAEEEKRILKQLAFAHHKFKGKDESQIELIKRQQTQGFKTDVNAGDTPRKAHLNKIQKLVTSYPGEKVKELGRDESQLELDKFRKLFDGFAKDLIYNKQIPKFKEFAHKETEQKVADMDDHKIADQALEAILHKNQTFTDHMQSLASVKNQKQICKIELSTEFKDMIEYICQFAGLKDIAKAEEYLKFMIEETNVLQLASHVKKTHVDEAVREKEEQEKNKTVFQKKLERQDSAMDFPHYESGDESELEEEPIKDRDVFIQFQTKTFEGVSEGIQVSLSRKLVQKLEFGELMKKDMGTTSNSEFQKDAKFQYVKGMQNLPKLPIPIFEPHYNKLKEFRLSQIQLSEGQCVAISQALPMMQNLRGIYIDSTGLSDAMFAGILNNIVKEVPCFRSITYKGKNNVLGEKSIEYLKQLINRPIPNQLTTLKVENVTILAIDTEWLVDAIVAKPTHLETLSLSQIQILEEPFYSLCKYVNQTYSLVDLNVSEMHMGVRIFAAMIKAISRNRKLQYLNLQGNTLVDAKADLYDLYLLGLEDEDNDHGNGGDHDADPEPQQPAKPDANKNKKGSWRKPVVKKKPQVKLRQGPKVNQDYILESFKEFLMNNQCLVHINLAQTGIDEDGLLDLAQTLKDAVDLDDETQYRNLRAIHLSCPDPMRKEEIFTEINRILHGVHMMAQMKGNIQHIREIDEQYQQDEMAHLHQMKLPKSQFNRSFASNMKNKISNGEGDDPETFCIQRMVCHSIKTANKDGSIEMNKWRLQVGPPSKCCWVCSKAIYTLIFAKVDPQDAKDNKVFTQFLPQQLQNFQQDQNHIAALSTSLKFQMMPVEKFAKHLDVHWVKNFDFLALFKKSGDFPSHATSAEQLDKYLRPRYDRLLEEFLEKEYKENWRKVLNRQLEYSKVQAIGDFTKNEADDNRTLMVTALMLKPGKHQYLIKANDTFLSRTPEVFVSVPRTEKIQFNKGDRQRDMYWKPFVLTKSEFREWTNDDNTMMKMVFDSDTKVWQLNKLLKNDNELRAATAVLRANAKKLKDLFSALASTDERYPKLGYFAFVDFCKSVRIIEDATELYPKHLISNVDWIMITRQESFRMPVEESNLTTEKTSRDSTAFHKDGITKNRKPQYSSFSQDQLGMCFAQTILNSNQQVKEHDAPLNLTTEKERKSYMVKTQIKYIEVAPLAKLTRCQFWEVLVRIAVAKYVDTEIEKNAGRATQRLIEEEVLKRIKVVSPSVSRNQFIHTRQIHRLVKANTEALRRVYEYFHDRETRAMTFQIATYNIMQRLFDINIDQARVIYARSKITIPNEQAHRENFTRLKYVEFLELICRIAMHKFGPFKEGESELTFVEQVTVIMEELFQKLGLVLNNPDIHSQVEASDDSEYLSARNSATTRRTEYTNKNMQMMPTSTMVSVDLSLEDEFAGSSREHDRFQKRNRLEGSEEDDGMDFKRRNNLSVPQSREDLRIKVAKQVSQVHFSDEGPEKASPNKFDDEDEPESPNKFGAADDEEEYDDEDY